MATTAPVQPDKLSEAFLHARKCGYAPGASDDEARPLWNEERFRAQTDLFWLAHHVLGYDLVDNFNCPNHKRQMSDIEAPCPICQVDMIPYEGGIPVGQSPHRQICSFFVQKNPHKSLPSQDTIKKRLLMYPRGSFKSSINEADTIQWIICFPNIRIGLMTAEEGLAIEFISKIKSFFQVPEDDAGTKIYTHFQLLFPEHCVPAKKKEDETKFLSPGRTKKITQATLSAISLKASTSGKHYDVGVFEDCVSNSNSGYLSTPDQRVQIRKTMELAQSLIDPYGYINIIGTPYENDDAYSYFVANYDKDDFIYKQRSCWEVKSTSLKKKPEDLTEEDYNLLFPRDSKQNDEDGTVGFPRLTYKFLKSKAIDAHNFACQYLCRPASGTTTVSFTEGLLKSHIVQSTGLPQLYRPFSAWDFAYSDNVGRDYSVGCAGWYDDIYDRLFILEIVRGRFNKSELSYQVAKQATRWKVESLSVEKSPGADFLENDIRKDLAKLGYADCPSINWFPVDNTKNAKNNRAQMVETWLTSDRLWFSAEIPIMSDVVREFVNYKAGSKRKDDCVDSIAHLIGQCPAAREIPQTEKARQQASWDILAQKQLHDRIYGVRENATPIQEFVPPSHVGGYPVACSGCGFSPCICH